MKNSLVARGIIGVGLALGAGLVAYGGWRVAGGARDEAPRIAAGPALATAVVAARPIPRGKTITADDLGSMRIEGPLPVGLIASPAAAAGRVAAVDLAANQLVLAATVAGDPAQAGLAALVPVGHRAISMDVTEEIAVANYLRPGDMVDIQIVLPAGVIAPTASGQDASESRTLLQNIRVLAIGSAPAADTSGPAGAARAGRTVTVAMDPEQISRFALARAVGRYFLTLRNPSDQVPGAAGLARVAHLRGSAAPAAPPRRQLTAPRPRTAGIELVVAGKREWLRPGAGS